jgi:hypothetical protein
MASRMFLKFLTIAPLLFASMVVARGNCPNIRNVDFRNHTYPLRERGFTQGTERLYVTNGRYEEPHDNPISVSFLYFEIVNVAFGDLNGDGKNEAAVTAVYGSNSGSFYLTDTYVFGCVDGRIILVGILKQDDIEKDTGMYLQESANNPMIIKHGALNITYGTEGNRPSPEFTTTFRYRIRRGKFVLARRPLRRKNY